MAPHNPLLGGGGEATLIPGCSPSVFHLFFFSFSREASGSVIFLLFLRFSLTVAPAASLHFCPVRFSLGRFIYYSCCRRRRRASRSANAVARRRTHARAGALRRTSLPRFETPLRKRLGKTNCNRATKLVLETFLILEQKWKCPTCSLLKICQSVPAVFGMVRGQPTA